jgi:pyruvate dehydrogenase E1 component beta subunit/2-oxoisovalerate dehydrogenase E1 component beta subunit
MRFIRRSESYLPRGNDVFLYGQDIGGFGGAFKATKGLLEEFPGRVMDSPISEDAMVGMAIGAAISGMRPIVEMQFADFSSIAFNQIANHAGTHYYRTGTPVPDYGSATLRRNSWIWAISQSDGGNSLRSLSWDYCADPGDLFPMPYHLLKESVVIDDPVVFCEHKFLYRWLKTSEIDPEPLPLGVARITRPGKHATVGHL